jgi:hypothetical protein
MSTQDIYLVVHIDEKMFICNNEEELTKVLSDAQKEKCSVTIDFIKNKERNEKLSKFYMKKFKRFLQGN